MKLLRDTAIALLIISVFPTVSLSIVTAPLQTLWEAIKIRSDVANFTPSLVFLRIDDGAILDPNSHRWKLNSDVYEVQFEKIAESSPRLAPEANAFGTWSYGFGSMPGETDVLGFGAAEYKRNVKNDGGDDITETGGRLGAVELFGQSGVVEPITGLVFYKHGDERFDPPANTLPGLPELFDDVPSGQHALVLGDNGHPAKIRWTAPETMTVSISGEFTRPLDTPVRVVIIKNDTEILFDPDSNTEGFTETQSAPFNFEETVDDGDTLDFTLAEAFGSDSNATALTATIQVTQFDLEGCGDEGEPPCSWFPDGFGGNAGTGWTGSGNVGFKADFPIPTEDAEYDIQLEIKTGPDLSPNDFYTVNFKPGGRYAVSIDERVVSFDDSAAGDGRVDIVVNASSTDPFPDHRFVYLGRFEFEAGSGSVTIDAERSRIDEEQNTLTHTPVSVWVAKAGESPEPLVYNDLNSVPSGWLHPGTTQFPHYWGNVTNDISVFRFAQYFPFPAQDRIGLSAAGLFEVQFSHFDIWHPQPAQIPVTVYFKPGGDFEEPDIDFEEGGFITNVDLSEADEGRVTVEITYPIRTFRCTDPDTGLDIGCESYPENAFSVGRYELDDTAMYGLKIRSTPTQIPGSSSITAEQVTLIPIGGACCLSNGSCAVLTEGDCKLAGGIFRKNGAPCETAECEGGVLFRRGDHDGSGKVDFTDAINLLEYVFLGDDTNIVEGLPRCLDASDANNDGKVDFGDAINILEQAFLGNRKLPAPGSEVCGLDPLGPVDDGGAVPPEGDGLPEQPAGIDEEGSFDVAPLDCGGYPNFDDPSSIPCDL